MEVGWWWVSVQICRPLDFQGLSKLRTNYEFYFYLMVVVGDNQQLSDGGVHSAKNTDDGVQEILLEVCNKY